MISVGQEVYLVGFYDTKSEMRAKNVVALVGLAFLMLSRQIRKIGVLAESENGCGYSFPPDQTSGAISSPNYPFGYKSGLSCDYKFYPQSNSYRSHICLTFLRFQLRGSCDSDFLEFPGGYKYCGNGILATLDGTSEDEEQADGVIPDTVWKNQFCWIATNASSPLTIQFVSRSVQSLSGFYAEFRVWEPEDKTGVIKCDEDHVVYGQDGVRMSQLYIPGCLITCPDGSVCDTEKEPECSCGDTAPCGVDQFTCFNRKCVPQSVTCDGRDDCGDYSDEEYGHSGCQARDLFNTIPVCDFELDNCGFLGMDSWKQVSPEQYQPRPKSDHTRGKNGTYLRTDFRDTTQVGESIQFFSQSNLAILEDGACLSFWYQMMSSESGTLKVFLGVTEVWKAKYGTGMWHSAKIYLPSKAKITFEATRGSDPMGLIALDDIYLSSGQCYKVYEPMCTFEVGACGWTQRGIPLGDTRQHTGDGWIVTENMDIGNGNFLYLAVTRNVSAHPERFSLDSPYVWTTSARLYCLRFRLYINSADLQIQMTSMNIEGEEEEVGTIRGSDLIIGEWQDVEMTLEVKELFKVFMRLVYLKVQDVIAIDDVSLGAGTCDADCSGTSTVTYTPPMPSVPSAHPCQQGHVTCDGTSRCIPEAAWCDSHSDCPGGQDEDKCDDDRSADDVSYAKSLSTLAILVVVAVAVILVLVIVTLSTVYACSKRRARERNRSARAAPGNETGQSSGANLDETGVSAQPILQTDDSVSREFGGFMDQATCVQPNPAVVGLPKYDNLRRVHPYTDSCEGTLVFERQGRDLNSVTNRAQGSLPLYRIRYLPNENSDPPPRYSFIMRDRDTSSEEIPHDTSQHYTSQDQPVPSLGDGRDPNSSSSLNIYTISGSLPSYRQALEDSTDILESGITREQSADDRTDSSV